MTYEEMLLDFAKEAAGNWKEFRDFGWSNDYISDPDRWSIFYTSNRDSGLIAQSNEFAIDKIMEKYVRNGTAHSERHNHWGHGYVDGYSFMVYNNKGKITAVCRAIFDLKMRMEEYPLLDEQDHSDREYESALEGIKDNSPGDVNYDLLPENWEGEVFSWLWENNQSELESIDDQGAYPSQKSVKEAIDNLWPDAIEKEE